MKRMSLLFTLLLAVSPMFFAGCEDPDDVRANPVSLEIDGTYFVTKPDGSFVWGPGGSSENPPDAAYRQHEGHFIFSIKDDLYDAAGNVCNLNVDFVGTGAVELGVRYQLAEPETPEYGSFFTSITYGGISHVVSEGWVEFSEFGVNEAGDRAYASGIFSLAVDDGAFRITGGKFGRMLECAYYNVSSTKFLNI